MMFMNFNSNVVRHCRINIGIGIIQRLIYDWARLKVAFQWSNKSTIGTVSLCPPCLRRAISKAAVASRPSQKPFIITFDGATLAYVVFTLKLPRD
jgi:hypothetical protein